MKRLSVLMFSFLLSLTYAQAEIDCTLKREQGNKKVVLKNQIEAEMDWSACTSIGRDLRFQIPLSEKISSPTAALKRAAELVEEWEALTKITVSPTEEVVPALKKRAEEKPDYVFGANIPVSAVNNIADYDGVRVYLATKGKKQQLQVKYWANP